MKKFSEKIKSKSPNDLCRILVQLQVNFSEEHLQEENGYFVDCVVSSSLCPTEKVLVEFDGPSHFGFDLKNKKMFPLGKTALKHRVLRKYGQKLVVVPFYEWGSLGTDEEKRMYLEHQITFQK